MEPHTHNDHKEEHLKSIDTLRDIVIGMSDGLTIPFALAAGLSAAISNSNIIVIAGIAEIAIGSIVMGLGGYLAGKTEQDHYKNEVQREYHEVQHLRHQEIAETKDFFANLGLSEDIQKQATAELAQDKDRWVSFMMKYELGLERPDPKRATKSALNIGVSYIVGGTIPLAPYFFIKVPLQALELSSIITLSSLFIFSYFKSRVTGVNAWWGATKGTLIGTIAAASAFAVAKIFTGVH